jgi:cell division septum initiation protein DivIVA
MADETFRLTALDVRRYDLGGTAWRGYDKARVDQFRAQVAAELEQLARHAQELEQKARNFHEQLRAFRDRDRALNEALVAAQQLRVETKDAADRDAELVRREARAEAERVVRDAQLEADRLVRDARGEAERLLGDALDESRRLARSAAASCGGSRTRRWPWTACTAPTWRSSGLMAERQLAELSAAEERTLPPLRPQRALARGTRRRRARAARDVPRVAGRPAQAALEEAMLARWEGERLFERAQAARAGGPPFVFYEGPPTANGRPGIHHVFARAVKDLVCRHRAMRGHDVPRKAGWDTHGLPVEIEIEKRLGISGKQDIERVGVAEFNRLCRESVFTYREEWERLSARMGYWLDYARPYVTYSNDYVESVWWALKTLHERGLLYQGHKILPYCPRCETALSSHEVAQGYQDVEDPSVYVALDLVPEAGDPAGRGASWCGPPRRGRSCRTRRSR